MTRLARWAAAALVLLAVATPAAAATAIDAQEMIARIDRALALAAEGEAAPSASVMARLRSTLDLPVTVRTTSGALDVRRDPLLDRLRGTAVRDFAGAAERLRVLRHEIVAANDAQPLDRAAIRRDVRASYRGITATPSIPERILRRLGRIVDRILEVLFTNQGAASALGWTVVVVALLALLVLARRAGVAPRRIPRAAERIERPEPADWRALADAALARGALDEAVRLEFVLLLERLVAAEILPDDDTVTTGECRRAVAAAGGSIVPAVGAACDAFDAIAYAGRAATEHDYAAVRAASEAAESVPRAEVAAA